MEDYDDFLHPTSEAQYYTISVPVTDIMRLKFKANTGLDLLEDSLDIEFYLEEDNYNLFSVNGKLVIYNNYITLTNQCVTSYSLEKYKDRTKYNQF